ncbi:MAG: hypothetical protein GY730_03700 [bacterium]|nr:hypothetical protein [bacterium]
MTNLKWNTVVVGHWNPAILTPKGMASLIFDKGPNEPIEILVPFNVMGPHRLKSEGVLASVSQNKLFIECEQNNWETLEKSKKYCCKAIAELPRTPLIAAGFNLNFTLQDEDEDEGFLSSISNDFLDNNISDAGLEIIKRNIHRSFIWKSGNINLSLEMNSNDSNILINFSKTSGDVTELKDWLNTSVDSVKEITKTIMCNILKIYDKDDFNEKYL